MTVDSWTNSPKKKGEKRETKKYATRKFQVHLGGFPGGNEGFEFLEVVKPMTTNGEKLRVGKHKGTEKSEVGVSTGGSDTHRIFHTNAPPLHSQ